MKQHVKAGLAGIAAGAIAATIGASVVVNMAVQDVNDSWSASATAEVAEWTQWAVDDQATQDAYATEEANANATADAESTEYAIEATQTEVAFPTEVAKHNATANAMAATEEAVALETATVSLAMTLTHDYFDNATQYARIAHDEAVEAATAEAHLPTRWAKATEDFPNCPAEKLKTNDDGSQFCEGS